MKDNNFPTKEEFYKNILKLKKEKELQKEAIYLGYLKEQKMKKKPRRLKQGENN